MTTARERLTAFCDNWNPGGNMDPDIIYGIWRTVDGQDRQFLLLLGDIRELLNSTRRDVA